MATVRLTKTFVDSLSTKMSGGIRYHDSLLPGFGVTVHPPTKRYPEGKRTFWVVYGPRNRRRRMTIGAYGVLTVEKARERARTILISVSNGRDPDTEERRKRETPLLRTWRDEYLVATRLRKKRPELDELYLRKAANRWGARPIDSIAPGEIEAAMQSIVEECGNQLEKKLAEAREAKDEVAIARLEAKKRPGVTSANRFLASVRACLQAAWRAGLITENPASKVRKFRENEPRARVLTEDEMKRLIMALGEEPSAFVKAAFRLLIETGARKSEVLRAKWEDFDLDAATPLWRIPSPKAGNPQVVPLASRTVAMLRQLPRLGPFVIPGRHPSKPLEDLRSPWIRLQERAELDGVTIHDLRRTFGLHAARAAGLHVASKLLRHSDVRITERVYAPLGIEDLAKAIEKAQRPAEVVQFPSALS